jgi:hypothetical protein
VLALGRRIGLGGRCIGCVGRVKLDDWHACPGCLRLQPATNFVRVEQDAIADSHDGEFAATNGLSEHGLAEVGFDWELSPGPGERFGVAGA